MAEDIPLAVRKIVYERDAYKCRWCGRQNGVSIHLHHIVYRSGGGQHVPENLISLCYEHHAEAHSSKNDYQHLLLDLVQEEPNVTMFQLMRWRKRPDVQIEVDPDEGTGPVGRFLAID